MKVLSISVFILFCTIPLSARDKPYNTAVAADGTGAFTSIQAAVNSSRDFTPLAPIKIFIRKGVYREKLVIPSWKTGIHFIGESRDSTIITNANFSGKPYPGNDWMGKDKFNTFNSYTVLLAGDHYRLENITMGNAAGQVGQAFALQVEGDRCAVSNYRLLGSQIGTKPGLKFDTEQIQVPADSKVKLVFNNNDDMLRNLVIVNPGKGNDVGKLAMDMRLSGSQQAYVPAAKDGLYNTCLLQPETSQTTYFTAPASPGDYTYVCTFPSHYAVMKGIMKVVGKK